MKTVRYIPLFFLLFSLYILRRLVCLRDNGVLKKNIGYNTSIGFSEFSLIFIKGRCMAHIRCFPVSAFIHLNNTK